MKSISSPQGRRDNTEELQLIVMEEFFLRLNLYVVPVSCIQQRSTCLINISETFSDFKVALKDNGRTPHSFNVSTLYTVRLKNY
ncbi:unnamed protein product [Colias eurytheme]|nr:unnamed protein product [Colias eurytheme]